MVNESYLNLFHFRDELEVGVQLRHDGCKVLLAASREVVTVK